MQKRNYVKPTPEETRVIAFGNLLVITAIQEIIPFLDTAMVSAGQPLVSAGQALLSTPSGRKLTFLREMPTIVTLLLEDCKNFKYTLFPHYDDKDCKLEELTEVFLSELRYQLSPSYDAARDYENNPHRCPIFSMLLSLTNFSFGINPLRVELASNNEDHEDLFVLINHFSAAVSQLAGMLYFMVQGATALKSMEGELQLLQMKETELPN